MVSARLSHLRGARRRCAMDFLGVRGEGFYLPRRYALQLVRGRLVSEPIQDEEQHQDRREDQARTRHRV